MLIEPPIGMEDEEPGFLLVDDREGQPSGIAVFEGGARHRARLRRGGFAAEVDGGRGPGGHREQRQAR